MSNKVTIHNISKKHNYNDEKYVYEFMGGNKEDTVVTFANLSKSGADLSFADFNFSADERVLINFFLLIYEY